MIRFYAFLALALVMGCHPRRLPPVTPVADPIAELQSPPTGETMGGSAQLQLRLPALDITGTVGAQVLVRRPGELWLQARGPFGRTLLQVAINPERIMVLLPSENLALVGMEPDDLLRDATGGALGVDGLLALLTGRLPRGDLPVVKREVADDRLVVLLDGPGELWTWVETDPAQARLQRVVLAREEEVLLEITYQGQVQAGDQDWPREVRISSPAQDTEIGLNIRSWEILDEPPLPWDAPPPDGFVVGDLVEFLQSLREEERSPERP